MGLTITPYQIRTPINFDHSERFRRLHMRAPLRSLIAPVPIEYPPPLEINARSLQNQLTEDIRRLNQDRPLSTNILNYRLHQRSRSNAK